MSAFKDLVGRQFERLRVIKVTTKRLHGRLVWKCKCSCGNTKKVISTSLLSGHTKSCGCLHREMAGIRAKDMGSIWGGKSLKDVSGTMINGIQVLCMSRKRGQRRQVYCFAICPSCKQEWEVQVGNIKNGISTQCKSCQYKQMTSKTATWLLDKLEEHLGLKVIREYKLGNKYFDGYIPDLKVLIESDGSHWHTKKQNNDLLKNHLAKTAGLQLIRVTNDSSADHERALTKILRTIGK